MRIKRRNKEDTRKTRKWIKINIIWNTSGTFKTFTPPWLYQLHQYAELIQISYPLGLYVFKSISFNVDGRWIGTVCDCVSVRKSDSEIHWRKSLNENLHWNTNNVKKFLTYSKLFPFKRLFYLYNTVTYLVVNFVTAAKIQLKH